MLSCTAAVNLNIITFLLYFFVFQVKRYVQAFFGPRREIKNAVPNSILKETVCAYFHRWMAACLFGLHVIVWMMIVKILLQISLTTGRVRLFLKKESLSFFPQKKWNNMRGDRGKWACGFEATAAAATEEADTAEGGKAVLEKWGGKSVLWKRVYQIYSTQSPYHRYASKQSCMWSLSMINRSN